MKIREAKLIDQETGETIMNLDTVTDIDLNFDTRTPPTPIFIHGSIPEELKVDGLQELSVADSTGKKIGDGTCLICGCDLPEDSIYDDTCDECAEDEGLLGG